MVRWITNLFLAGRNVYTDDFYGKRMESPVCECRQQRDRPTLLHYVHCPERRAASDSVMAAMVHEQGDQAWSAILKQVRDRAILNPRVCLSLDLEDFARHAGALTRIRVSVYSQFTTHSSECLGLFQSLLGRLTLSKAGKAYHRKAYP